MPDKAVEHRASGDLTRQLKIPHHVGVLSYRYWTTIAEPRQDGAGWGQGSHAAYTGSSNEKNGKRSSDLSHPCIVRKNHLPFNSYLLSGLFWIELGCRDGILEPIVGALYAYGAVPPPQHGE